MRPLSLDIVVPRVDRERFTGGILCVLEYAQRLAELGHSVRVVPATPSPRAQWCAGTAFDYYEHPVTAPVADPLAGVIGNADVTVATTCDTALPVARNASGPKVYFMQHFGPYFTAEADVGGVGGVGGQCLTGGAPSPYELGMTLVANSSWLRSMVAEHTGRADVALCPNGIRLEHFHPPATDRPPRTAGGNRRVTVISYGGRNAEWKGFREMVHAVARVRRERPEVSLRWQVYGGALIPPRNGVADYEDLGFLDQRALGDAYREADVLLSASWYESFPLFPLEAMACGVATITSACGTEDYARHGVTAHLVEPRDAGSIAAGLRLLVDDAEHRRRLGRAGASAARHFTWERAVTRMDSILRAVTRT
jgi:glycosyltransferase involved in cell wall biosynthesis